MELLLLPSRAAAYRPRLPTSPRRRAGATTYLPAASFSDVDVIDTTATTSGGVAKNRQEWRVGGPARLGLGLDLSEEMRRGMMWRMLAPPAVAVVAEAAFLRLLDGVAADAPAWAGAAGSAALFAVGLLGFHYGFLSSRWDAAERGSWVGWELAVRHWNVMSMAKDSFMEDEDEDIDEEEEEEEEGEEEEEDDDDDEEEEVVDSD